MYSDTETNGKTVPGKLLRADGRQMLLDARVATTKDVTLKRHAADSILHLLGKRFGWTLHNQTCYMYTSQIFKQTKHGSRRSQNLAIFGIFISPPGNMKRGRKHTGAEFFFAHVSRESSLL